MTEKSAKSHCGDRIRWRHSDRSRTISDFENGRTSSNTLCSRQQHHKPSVNCVTTSHKFNHGWI